MRKSFLLALPFALLGCGADVAGACQNYFDAYEACVVEYVEANGGDASAYELGDTYCDDTYGSIKDKESADYLNCLADVYAAADCSTTDGWTAASTDIGNCTL